MRPLELRLRNFRSYFGEEAAFDFRDRKLVGIVGPIGSGKSSLLDAVSFALYGKTPMAGASTKSLIHQRATDGGVMLRFEVEGEVWEAVRSLRRRGASQHALYRYDGDVAGAEPVERITLESDVNTKIATLLGLDYDAFGRSVMLAQGRFAEFLRSRPAERDAVLKGVFGHDRIDAMRDVAKAEAAAADRSLGKVLVRTERLDDVAARLATMREGLAAAEVRVETLQKAEPTLVDLEARIEAATSEERTARRRLDELSRHAARLPEEGATQRLVSDAAAMTAKRVKLAAELGDSRQAAAAAEEAMAEAHRGSEAARIDEAGGLVAAAEQQRRAAAEAQRRRETVERELAGAQQGLLDAEAEKDAADDAADAAAAALQDAARSAQRAEADFHAAQHRNMAEVLRTSLEVGEACPVCAQDVGVVPPLGSVEVAPAEADLAAAREARSAAEQARSLAAARASAAAAAVDASSSNVASRTSELAQDRKAEKVANAALETTSRRLGVILGDGDPAVALEERRRQLAAITEAVADARRCVDQVRGKHDQVILDEQSVTKQLSALRIDVADLAARLGTEVVVDDDGPEALGRSVAELRTAWDGETKDLEAVATAAGIVIKRATNERKEMLAALGIDGEFSAALGAAEATAEHLAQDVAKDEAEVEAGADLRAERDRLAAVKAQYQHIATDLTDSRFVRFLLDDERARLADLGSDHFSRLSSGRYRFTEDGTFAIVDLTAADAERKASTLSGGETFLASLALALSLAEMVARTGGRLDAFFLDEGFGSLDPEHLDLAMEGIEALVADDSSRLVVVVSHVPELRHRIEDLIELDRHPLTGDTRVVRS